MKIARFLVLILLSCSPPATGECTDFGSPRLTFQSEEIDEMLLKAAARTWTDKFPAVDVVVGEGSANLVRFFDSDVEAEGDIGHARPGLLRVARRLSRRDLQTVLAHEIGHFLGVGHLAGRGHLMSTMPLESGGFLDGWDMQAARHCGVP